MQPNNAPRYASFRDYLRVARERRLLIVIVTLLFVAAAIIYSIRQPDVYQADAALVFQAINTQTSPLGTNIDPGGETPEQRSASAAATLLRPAVLDRAAKKLGFKGDSGVLGNNVVVRPEARTQLVIVSARAGTGDSAAALANAIAIAATEVTRDETRDLLAQARDAETEVLKGLSRRPASAATRVQLEQKIAALDELSRIVEPAKVRREASVPRVPVEPRPIQTTLLGLLIGLTLGLVAAFTRDSLDRRFKSSHEITEELHMPLLGYVPEDVLGRTLIKGKGRKALTEPELEGFRILRTNIEFLDVDKAPKLVLVTSTLPQEGKSTIAAGLATAYSMAGKRTLVVECDLRRPTLSQRFGIRPTPGLTDYLIGHAGPQEVLQTIAPPALPTNGSEPGSGQAVPFVTIVAGTAAPQPAELLRSKRCRSFFEQVKDVYDVVIVDTAPLLSVVDALELLPVADAVVMCVRASKTTRDQARAARAALSHFPDRPTGIVLTGIRARDEAFNYGYYSYGYVYGAGR